MMCLNIQYGVTKGTLMPNEEMTNNYKKTVHEKHQCFQKALPGLSHVGRSITSLIAINMRKTPGGASLKRKTIKNKVYQVLGYDILGAQGRRYYLVSENNQLGYIYAGDKNDYTKWTQSATHSELNLSGIIIAQENDRIQITSKTGINLRTKPMGEILSRVPNKHRFSVEDVQVVGSSDQVFYKLTYNNIMGYVYGGKIKNGNTLKSWVKYVSPLPTKPTKVSSSHAILGDVIKIINPKGINLRKRAGGRYLTHIPKNASLYVFETLIKGSNRYLYYRVSYKGRMGYIYGGRLSGKTTSNQWGKRSSKQLAKMDTPLLILASRGINLRSTPGGSVLQHIPHNASVNVLSKRVRGFKNYVYYKVSYQGKTGYIYSGYLSPLNTVDSWTRF
jgi:hypothetical protein